MVRFKNHSDMLQYYCNEYIKPKDLVLVLGFYSQHLKNIFLFIGAEPIFVGDNNNFDIIIESKLLPFEKSTFDIIFNFTKEDVQQFLKPNGNILTFF